MRIIVLFAVLCVLSFAGPVSAELYRWTDENGRESYTDDLKNIPQKLRGKAERVEGNTGNVSVGNKPTTPDRPSRSGAEHKDKYGHGEAYWRNRAEKDRRDLRNLQDEYDLVLKKEREQEEKGKTALGKGKKKKSKTNYANKKLQLEKKIAQTKRRLEVDLPEEARKADAYPGWIRE